MVKEKDFNPSGIEIGLYTLGDIGSDPHTGKTTDPSQRMREIIEAAKLADEAGLDVFGVGEHHRLDYVLSSPPVVLAAIAQVTKRTKLTSATTVLSTIDPVRLFEDFATLDLISNGRAEIMAGRGAFVESFPLFGFNPKDYDALFSENMDLFLKLNQNEILTWEGHFRSSLRQAEIAPRPVQKQIPIWIGVGGSPESAIRAGRLGVGMVMAILGGNPDRFIPLAEAYREAGRGVGYVDGELKLGVTGHGYISKTTQQAKEEFYPYYASYKSYVGRQLGKPNGKLEQSDFEHLMGSEGALFVGSPQQIIEKILRQYELFGHQRVMMQMDIGGLPFSKIAAGIELLATEIAPIVRRETSR